jgi:ketosteroid isomerase-like protein
LSKQNDNENFVLEYLRAVESGATGDNLAQFYTADVLQEEFPNQLVVNGARRDLAALLDAAQRGQKVVTEQRFEVKSIISSGDTVALEIVWVGRLAIPFGTIPVGGEMRAHIATFIEFRDGRICAQRNYDCYDPW